MAGTSPRHNTLTKVFTHTLAYLLQCLVNGRHRHHHLFRPYQMQFTIKGKGKGSPYSITDRRVSELIRVLGSQPASDVSHKPGGRLPLLSARPAVTPPQSLRGLLPVLLLGEEARWV